MTTKKTIFVPDKLNDDAIALLEEQPGFEVDSRAGLSLEDKLRAAARAHAVIVRSATRVDAAFLESASVLELVVRAGVGVDNIDVETATRRGVVVQNVPEGNTRSAAEHTIALILALSRNVPQAHASLREGRWEPSKFLGVEVQGKTLGVIGLGKIGRQVVQMALGLGFRVLAFDPFVAPHMAEQMGVELIRDVGELASQSDFLTVHVPKSPETTGLLGKDVFSRARKGLRVINCARGGIVDEAALLAALESGAVAGAALDVFAQEPTQNLTLVQHPKVVATPHLGASTREAQENVALASARQVIDFFTSGRLHAPVNAVSLDPDVKEGLEPYGELAYKLGVLQSQLLAGNPERVVLKCYGSDFDPKVQNYVASMALAGFLKNRSASPVNRINAQLVARDQGLAVETRNEGTSKYFVNMVKVEVKDSAGSRELGGTIRGRRGLRLVSLDNYQFDAILEGVLLIVANEDRPGMIGAIGQSLGSHGINISSMSLGRDRSGGTAVALLNVDGVVSGKVTADLLAVGGILWAKVVDVG